MRDRSDNICKFVTSTTGERLITENFVCENNAPPRGDTRLDAHHAMYLVLSGRGKLATEFFAEEMEPGVICFTFAGTPYHIENAGDLRYMYVSFQGERASELFERFHISVSRCAFRGYEGLLPYWQECLGLANDKNLDLISESVLLYTFSKMSAQTESEEERLLEAMYKYIEENFSDHRLSLSSVAEALGYSSKYISHIFAQGMGVTFSEYLRNTRIRYAVFLMEHGITSVKNVALLSGYRDPFYFSKVFRQAIGMTPTQFMEESKGKRNTV